MHDKYLPKDINGKLARLTEECGEVLQIIGKIGRFGWHSYNPHELPSERKENWQLLEMELEDLKHAIGQYLEEAEEMFKTDIPHE